MESPTHDSTARVISLSDGVFGFALTLLVFPFETTTQFAQVLDFVRLKLTRCLCFSSVFWSNCRHAQKLPTLPTF